MDLISRTAMAEEVGQLKSIIKECTNTDYYKGYVCALSGVEGMIAQQPTIDAVPVVNMAEHDNEVRNRTINEFAELLYERCDAMIKDSWNSGVAPISWSNAYADFKNDIEDTVENMRKGGA